MLRILIFLIIISYPAIKTVGQNSVSTTQNVATDVNKEKSLKHYENKLERIKVALNSFTSKEIEEQKSNPNSRYMKMLALRDETQKAISKLKKQPKE